MKITKTNFDVDKRDFYNKVRERKDELSAVLYAANLDGVGFKDFNEWYTQEYDWRFLRDILGERDKKGLPWDYNTLIHLPVWVWKNAKGNEQRIVIKGEVSPDDLGLGITEMEGGDGITVTRTEGEDEHILFNVAITPSETENQYLKTVLEDGELKVEWAPVSSDDLREYVDQQTAAVLQTAEKYTDENKVIPSTQKFSGAPDIAGFTIGNDQYNIASGSTIDKYIKSAKVEDATLTLTDQDDKNVTFTKPTKTSELTNDSGFLTEHQSIKTIANNTITGTGNITLDDLDVYNKADVDLKIATGTGLYLGWLQDTVTELPDENTIGTWIDAQPESAWNPSYPEKFTNNDYIFIYFPAVTSETGDVQVYWRCKYVQESGSTEHSWKKDLEFTSDVVGLATQVAKNTAAITSEINRATAAEATKVSKITTSGYGAYGHSDGVEKDWTISANADEKTLAYRTTGGVLRVGTPTEDDNATTKKYVDDLVGNIETILTTLNTGTGAK